MKKNILKLTFLLGTTLFFSMTGYCNATVNKVSECMTEPQINIAVFQKIDGYGAYRFLAHLKYSNTLTPSHGRPQFIPLNKVVEMNKNSTSHGSLDSGTNNLLQDSKAQCQLTMKDQEDSSSISGTCDIRMMSKNHGMIEFKSIIKPTALQTGKGWKQLYKDDINGIIIYASETQDIN